MTKMTHHEEEAERVRYYHASRVAENAKKIREMGYMDSQEAAKERKAVAEMKRIEELWVAAH